MTVYSEDIGDTFASKGLSTEPIENHARNGTTQAVGELIERTVMPKVPKSLGEDDHDLFWCHRQERQSAHDSTRAFTTEETDRRELGGIHTHHTRGWKPIREQLDEGRAVFDERKAL